MTLSLELSKRLHELGVKVESRIYWTFSVGGWNREGIRYHDDYGKAKINKNQFPAPGFEKLWAVLPKMITVNNNHLHITMGKLYEGDTYIKYVDYTHKKYSLESIWSKSPTEAAGMLLIWLVENGHKP